MVPPMPDIVEGSFHWSLDNRLRAGVSVVPRNNEDCSKKKRNVHCHHTNVNGQYHLLWGGSNRTMKSIYYPLNESN